MKKFFSSSVVLALVFASVSPYAVAADSIAPAAAATSASTEPTEVIVKLTSSSGAAIASVENMPGITVTDILPDNTVIVEASTSAAVAADQLNELPQVKYAEPSYSRAAFSILTNDTFRNQLWGLDNIGQFVNGTIGTAGDDIDAVRAWQFSYGTSTIVAVIDSGVLYAHPDLAANMWDGTACVDDQGTALGGCLHGYDFEDTDLDPSPVSTSTAFAHGTHVAGIIAAARNNGIGVIGVAPSAKIMALRFGFDTATEVRAIDFARMNGAKVINASFGGTQFSQAEYDAIKRFTDAGGIFVAAAGNSAGNSDSAPLYPAAYDLPGIISVAATDQNDALASFSNYGTTTIDIAAPGVNIASTYISGTSTANYAWADGTSMATPYVAGTVALIESLFPTASSSIVKSAILSGGDIVPSLASTTVSGRRLNAYTALLLAGNIDVTPPVITLVGSSTISLNVGDAYAELGATATDDRDATTTVIIGGDTVATSTAGTYHVTYDATDAAGNHATQVIRTVVVNAVVVPAAPASVPTPVFSGGGGGGGGGGGSWSYTPPTSSSTSGNNTAAATTTASTTNAIASSSPTVPRPALTPAAGYKFMRSLSLGSHGTDVTALQTALTRVGVYSGPITTYFGSMTRVAVKAYQALHNLDKTGSLGPKTRALLNAGL